MRACTRPVRGSIATTAPCAAPSPARAASPTATSQAEALAGSTTELSAGARRVRERCVATTADSATAADTTSASRTAVANLDSSRHEGETSTDRADL
jgi:hypothetical protein